MKKILFLITLIMLSACVKDAEHISIIEILNVNQSIGKATANITWETNYETDCTINVNNKIYQTQGLTHSVDIYNLDPETNYEYLIVANSLETDKYKNPAQHNGLIATQTRSDINIENIVFTRLWAENKIKITFETDALSIAHILYSDDDTFSNEKIATTLNYTSFSVTIDNLEPAKEWNFKIVTTPLSDLFSYKESTSDVYTRYIYAFYSTGVSTSGYPLIYVNNERKFIALSYLSDTIGLHNFVTSYTSKVIRIGVESYIPIGIYYGTADIYFNLLNIKDNSLFFDKDTFHFPVQVNLISHMIRETDSEWWFLNNAGVVKINKVTKAYTQHEWYSLDLSSPMVGLDSITSTWHTYKEIDGTGYIGTWEFNLDDIGVNTDYTYIGRFNLLHPEFIPLFNPCGFFIDSNGDKYFSGYNGSYQAIYYIENTDTLVTFTDDMLPAEIIPPATKSFMDLVSYQKQSKIERIIKVGNDIYMAGWFWVRSLYENGFGQQLYYNSSIFFTKKNDDPIVLMDNPYSMYVPINDNNAPIISGFESKLVDGEEKIFLTASIYVNNSGYGTSVVNANFLFVDNVFIKDIGNYSNTDSQFKGTVIK